MSAPLKRNSLSALERIKSRKLFDLLFESGNTLKSYPVRMVWTEIPYNELTPLKMGVSVPKRNMAHAVDRNRMKRLVRESFRLNKQALCEVLKQKEKSVALLFIVQSKTPLTFTETQ